MFGFPHNRNVCKIYMACWDEKFNNPRLDVIAQCLTLLIENGVLIIPKDSFMGVIKTIRRYKWIRCVMAITQRLAQSKFKDHV